MKDLKLNGFHYDDAMVENLGEVYYERDDNEDDYIAIFPDTEESERRVIIFYIGCQIAFVTTFINEAEHAGIEDYINDRISKYYKD